jgi:hypothetical protein
MTDLHQLLAERAARAPQSDDVDRVLAGARERAEQRQQRRRHLVAAGGGAAVVAALVAAAVTVPGAGGGRTGSADGPARDVSSSAPRGNVSPSAPRASSSWTSPTRLPSPPVSGSVSEPLHASPGPVRLVRIATPAAAPLAVSLVPAGWTYVGKMEAATTYAPASAANRDPNYFLGKLALMVDTNNGGSFPLRVGGRPARYAPGLVTIRVTAAVQADIQVPSAAHLTRAQVLRIAATLQVRDISHPASG